MLTVNEIFYSLQGEGIRQGTPNVFVRFSGCNLTCSVDNEAGFDCDTEFTSGVKYTVEQLLEKINKLGNGCKNVILTGGEPSLQVNAELIKALKHDGWYIAIETNGTKELPDGLDWITVSPKSAEHTLKQLTANEVKYVRFTGTGIPKTKVKADFYLISPAFNADLSLDRKHLVHCIKLVKENPDWRLSVQQHKEWMVR